METSRSGEITKVPLWLWGEIPWCSSSYGSLLWAHYKQHSQMLTSLAPLRPLSLEKLVALMSLSPGLQFRRNCQQTFASAYASKLAENAPNHCFCVVLCYITPSLQLHTPFGEFWKKRLSTTVLFFLDDFVGREAQHGWHNEHGAATCKEFLEKQSQGLWMLSSLLLHTTILLIYMQKKNIIFWCLYLEALFCFGWMFHIHKVDGFFSKVCSIFE